MKIYIATPVNGRKEATLNEKRLAACNRVRELVDKLREKYPNAEFHSSFSLGICPIGVMLSESAIMGLCVQRVMESDVVFFDWGYEQSKGCTVEHTTALTYGKKIIHAYDLSIEPEKL